MKFGQAASRENGSWTSVVQKLGQWGDRSMTYIRSMQRPRNYSDRGSGPRPAISGGDQPRQRGRRIAMTWSQSGHVRGRVEQACFGEKSRSGGLQLPASLGRISAAKQRLALPFHELSTWCQPLGAEEPSPADLLSEASGARSARQETRAHHDGYAGCCG
jgi:hypothetical protein